jgi:hypothetical protein
VGAVEACAGNAVPGGIGPEIIAHFGGI